MTTFDLVASLVSAPVEHKLIENGGSRFRRFQKLRVEIGSQPLAHAFDAVAQRNVVLLLRDWRTVHRG